MFIKQILQIKLEHHGITSCIITSHEIGNVITQYSRSTPITVLICNGFDASLPRDGDITRLISDIEAHNRHNSEKSRYFLSRMHDRNLVHESQQKRYFLTTPQNHLSSVHSTGCSGGNLFFNQFNYFLLLVVLNTTPVKIPELT